MTTSKAVLIVIIATLVTSPTFAQNNGAPAENATLVARLSYNSTWFVSADQKTSPWICFAVFNDGRYRMLRRTPDGKTQRVQGVIVLEELGQVEAMLTSPSFGSLTSQVGGVVVRSGSESFIAEVPREKGVQRLLLMNPDREDPFPEAAAEVVDWLQRFEPKHTEKLLETEFSNICPQLGPGVRPIFAGNLGLSSPFASISRGPSGTSSAELP